MIIRSLFLLLPLAIWTYLFIYRNMTTRQLSASLLGFVWAFLSILIVNSILVELKIWQSVINDNLFYGVPLDWVFSQAIIFGALIPHFQLSTLSRTGTNAVHYLTQCLTIIIVYMSAGLEFVNITAGLIALCILVFCSIPALLLANWTANDTHIHLRSLLQAAAWACLLLWLFPSTVFYLTTGNWNILLERNIIMTGLYLLPLTLPCSLIISALYQFAIEGNGTAFPYDPPKNLVTGGIYRYVSNPMQLGICLMTGWWGLLIGNTWVSISALVAVILFIVFQDVCNGSCAIGKGNKDWETYQQAVPKWIPRLKPWKSECKNANRASSNNYSLWDS